MGTKNIRLINRIASKQSLDFIARKEGMSVEEVEKFTINYAPNIIKRIFQLSNEKII